VHPGASLFVYPYLPIAYFLTQARNPTRYAYLNPGMMTHADEAAVLAQLQADPPEWLLYLRLSREEFLRVFPHGGNAGLAIPDAGRLAEPELFTVRIAGDFHRRLSAPAARGYNPAAFRSSMNFG
jgi:hypothetical protein